MFRKILGVITALAVAGAIVMVAITPRREGFFPGLLEYSGQFRLPAIKPKAAAPAIEEIREAMDAEPQIQADTTLTMPVSDSIAGERLTEGAQ